MPTVDHLHPNDPRRGMQLALIIPPDYYQPLQRNTIVEITTPLSGFTEKWYVSHMDNGAYVLEPDSEYPWDPRTGDEIPVDELRRRLNLPTRELWSVKMLEDELRWTRGTALNLLMEVEALRASQRDLRAKLKEYTDADGT